MGEKTFLTTVSAGFLERVEEPGLAAVEVEERADVETIRLVAGVPGLDTDTVLRAPGDVTVLVVDVTVEDFLADPVADPDAFFFVTRNNNGQFNQPGAVQIYSKVAPVR